MALLLIDISKNANTLTLRDNGSIAPVSVTLKHRYWTDAEFVSIVLDAEDITAILSVNGLTINPLFLDLSTESTAVFADGEHHFQLDVDGVILNLKVLINKAAEACIVSATGKLSERDQDCPEAERILNKLIRWRFAADIKHDLADYDGAHNLIVAVNKLCCGMDCDCNNQP